MKWGSVTLCVVRVFLSTSALSGEVCAPSSTVNGVDVSDYQPGISWNQVYQSGRHFVFIKATEGIGYTDETFASDWKSAKAAGLDRGAYAFFNPADDPVDQADYFLRVIGKLAKNDLAPVLDWEETNGVPNETSIARAKVWLEHVQKISGKVPMIYVNPGFWDELGDPSGFAQYPLYIADYGVKCPYVPYPWKSWAFWQRGQGDVTGISSDSDVDLFNGNLQKL